MRKPILAGNWKLNKTPAEAVEFVRALQPKLADYVSQVETVVCPSFVCLPAVADALAGVKIGVGAQNMHWAENGAYTGEVSATMLKGLAGYVIIGHSERRQYFAETDESVNKKIVAALAHGLIPIVCVGEDLAQNEAGVTETFVSGQVRAAFAGISADQARGVVVAYEPIWAIGTGKTATSEVANRVCGAGRPRRPGWDLRRGGGAGHPHPVRRQRQREKHRRVDGDAGHRRRADRRRQPEGGRLRRDGARDRGAIVDW